ncbi:MAG: tandem-95 repeat protein, partial [Nitrospira sp.]|nr:tandem-95 repeat protein [Nitrospira sp.]
MLETEVGDIETQLVVTDGLQLDWLGLLAGETPPTISNLSGDSLAYSEGAGAVVIEQGGNAIVSDVDSTNFDTGTLTVCFAAGSDSAEDVLGIRNQGTGAGQIGRSGSNVTYQGVTIGTFTGGSSGSNLVITLNSSATPTAVTALVKNITYENTDTAAPTTGARTVRFVLTDGDGGTSANYDTTVTVTGQNDAPVNTVPGAQTVTEDTPLSLSGLSVNDVDGNLSTVQLGVLNGTVSVTLQGAASISAGSNGSGTLTLSGSQADINATLATLVYQGTLNFTGSDTLTVTSTDANSGSDVDTVAITVTAVNDPTVVTGGTSGSGNEDTTLTGTLTATDAEGLSDGTVFSVSTTATNGTASIDPATGLWSYTPNADYNGSDSFTVTITDDAGNTATQVISVTVTPVVDLTNDSLTTNEDSAISANVLTGTNGATADSFEGTPVLTSVTQGANGSVTFLANGTVTYTPNANFNGPDSFTYTITSGGVTETATVTVTVSGVNDAPTITSLSGDSLAYSEGAGAVVIEQ